MKFQTKNQKEAFSTAWKYAKSGKNVRLGKSDGVWCVTVV